MSDEDDEGAWPEDLSAKNELYIESAPPRTAGYFGFLCKLQLHRWLKWSQIYLTKTIYNDNGDFVKNEALEVQQRVCSSCGLRERRPL